MCSHSTIVSCVFFILSCTTCLFQFFVRYICIILLLRHKYSAPLQHQRNWCQPPLPTTCHPSRANGGTAVLVPDYVGPSIPPPSHQRPLQSIHITQPVAHQPAHKSQFLLADLRPIPIRSSRYDLSDMIQTIQLI